jgi:hypothetical protein
LTLQADTDTFLRETPCGPPRKKLSEAEFKKALEYLHRVLREAEHAEAGKELTAG